MGQEWSGISEPALHNHRFLTAALPHAQVMKLLRKHGLVEGGGGRKRRPAAAGAPRTRADDMDLFDEGAVGAVPQPQPQLVMHQLKDIQKAYGALRLGAIGKLASRASVWGLSKLERSLAF